MAGKSKPKSKSKSKQKPSSPQLPKKSGKKK